MCDHRIPQRGPGQPARVESLRLFASVLGRVVSGTRSGVGVGLAYGGAWWFLGPLTLMPLLMGMGFALTGTPLLLRPCSPAWSVT